MIVPEKFQTLAGRWRGINLLHLSWLPNSPFKSDSDATVSSVAGEGFLRIEYSWAHDDAPQDGLLVIGAEKISSLVKVFWIDSWHLSDKFMVSEGPVGGDDAISVKGFYAVPDHPDWGWRTTIRVKDADAFEIVMYNVSPEGEESLAVEATYARRR